MLRISCFCRRVYGAAIAITLSTCRSLSFVKDQCHLIDIESLRTRAKVLMSRELDLFEQLVNELVFLYVLLLQLMHERFKLVEIVRQVVGCLVHETYFTIPHVRAPYDAVKKHGLASALNHNHRATS